MIQLRRHQALHYRAVMALADEVRSARMKRDWTQADLAQAAGISPRYVSSIENGQNVTMDVLQRVAAALGLERVTVGNLEIDVLPTFEHDGVRIRPEAETSYQPAPSPAPMTIGDRPTTNIRLGEAFDIVDPNPQIVRLKVRAHVAAGHGGWDDDVGDEWVDVPDMLIGPNDFVVQARGDSMVDEGIHDGDYVLVTRVQPNMAPTGQIVIAWLNDGLVIKRWARRASRKVLYSANPEWPEREITPDDSFEIQAIVKFWWHNPKTRAAELARMTRENGKKKG